jgi:hypothetical protein
MPQFLRSFILRHSYGRVRFPTYFVLMARAPYFYLPPLKYLFVR